MLSVGSTNNNNSTNEILANSNISSLYGVQFNTPYIHQIAIISGCILTLLTVIVLFFVKVNSDNNKAWKKDVEANSSSAPITRVSSFTVQSREYGSTESLEMPTMPQNEAKQIQQQMTVQLVTRYDCIGGLLHLQKFQLHAPKRTKLGKKDKQVSSSSFYYQLDIESDTVPDPPTKKHKIALDWTTTNKSTEIHMSTSIVTFTIGNQVKLPDKIVNITVTKVHHGIQETFVGCTEVAIDKICNAEQKFLLSVPAEPATHCTTHQTAKLHLDMTFKPSPSKSTIILKVHSVYSVHLTDNHPSISQILVRVCKSDNIEYAVITSKLYKYPTNRYVIGESINIEMENSTHWSAGLQLDVALANDRQQVQSLGVVKLGGFANSTASGHYQWKLALDNPHHTISLCHSLQ